MSLEPRIVANSPEEAEKIKEELKLLFKYIKEANSLSNNSEINYDRF